MPAATAGNALHADDRARRRSIAFLNWAHALDHFVLLIYPTVVIGLEVVYQRPYSELIALSSTAFVAFGLVFAARRLARRPLEPPQHDGGVLYRLRGLAGADCIRAEFNDARGRACSSLGIFAAIYHPVGMAMLIEASNARGRTLAFNGVCGNLGVSLAAGISAALATWLGWRAAFLAPALLCVITGIVYLWMTPDDRHHAEVAPIKTGGAADGQGCSHVVRTVSDHRAQRRTCFQRVDHRAAEDRRRRRRRVACRWCWSAASPPAFSSAARWRSSPSAGWSNGCTPHHLFAGRDRARIRSAICGRPMQPASPLLIALAHRDCRDLRPGDGQRHDPGALHRRRLARPRLCGALFPRCSSAPARRLP